jgi:peroxiredoxin
MAKQITPACEFGRRATEFNLLGVDGRYYSLQRCRGAMGILVAFISNTCPFVKAIRRQLVEDAKRLNAMGIGVVAINSNDPSSSPEDAFPYMKSIAQQCQFHFPYLVDDSQTVAKAYGAVCTPDFFGFNANMELQYRGRLRAPAEQDTATHNRELVEAMRQIALTGQGPRNQYPSEGCRIRWRKETCLA